LDPIQRQLRLLDEKLGEKASLGNWLFARSPLLLPAIGLIAGIIMQYFFSPPIILPVISIVAVTIISIFFIVNRKHPATLIILAVAAFMAMTSLGMIRFGAFNQPKANDISRFVKDDRTLATITGTVITEPKTEDRDAWHFGQFMPTPPYTSFYLKVDQVETKDGPEKLTGTVRVQVSDKLTEIKQADYVRIYCWLSRFSTPLNPGQFDIAKYLSKMGVFLSASVKTKEGIELLEHNDSLSILKLKTKLKKIVSACLVDEPWMDEHDQALLAALLLGQRANIDDATHYAFIKTGLLHLISLSGMHMGILAAFIWWICKKAGMSKRKRALICGLLIALYILVIPPRAPALRAAYLCWFFCASVIVRRKPNPLNTLSFTAIVLLLIRPMDLFNPGWQLSYTTVLGIILLYGRVSNFIFEKIIDKIKLMQSDREKTSPLKLLIANIVQSTAELLAVGIAAWTGGAGVLLYHFGSITPLACLWTVIVFPFVLAILGIGFLKMALAMLLPTLSTLLGVILASLVSALAWLVRFIAEIDLSPIVIGQVWVGLIVFYYCLVLLVRFGHFKKPNTKKIVCLTMAFVVLVSLGAIKYQRTNRDHLELTCLAVGHGQAIVIQLPGKETLLFNLTMQNQKRLCQCRFPEKNRKLIDCQISKRICYRKEVRTDPAGRWF